MVPPSAHTAAFLLRFYSRKKACEYKQYVPGGPGDGRDTHVPCPGGDRLISQCHAVFSSEAMGVGSCLSIHPSSNPSTLYYIPLFQLLFLTLNQSERQEKSVGLITDVQTLSTLLNTTGQSRG